MTTHVEKLEDLFVTGNCTLVPTVEFSAGLSWKSGSHSLVVRMINMFGTIIRKEWRGKRVELRDDSGTRNRDYGVYCRMNLRCLSQYEQGVGHAT